MCLCKKAEDKQLFIPQFSCQRQLRERVNELMSAKNMVINIRRNVKKIPWFTPNNAKKSEKKSIPSWQAKINKFDRGIILETMV